MKRVISMFIILTVFLFGCHSPEKLAKNNLANETSSTSVSSNTRPKLDKYSDIRNISLAGIDFTNQDELVKTLWFSQKTSWPESVNSLTSGNPERLIRDAMNPGLGVRELHQQGITGEGVKVAIIDQPMYTNHPEFEGKIAAYRDFNCNSGESMHGPAVTSLLNGENIGTAPGTQVYYAAVPSWLGDAKYYADALNWIIEENKKLAGDDKIRVVSVSAAPSGEGSPFTKNNETWDRACEEAERSGILVLDCTGHKGIIAPCTFDIDNPEDIEKCTPGFPGAPIRDSMGKKIFVPTSPRTTAEQYTKTNFSYQYTGRGGLSWAIPYCSGVLAMGWQVNPELTQDEIVEILFKTAYITKDRCRIINPKEFINAIKELE